MFEVIEEGAYERRIEVLNVQLRRFLSKSLRRKGKQQSEGVTVGSDCIGAGAKLRLKSICEEALYERRESWRVHRVPPRVNFSMRSVARIRSSGTAWMYQ
jgi:hypothetical protein